MNINLFLEGNFKYTPFGNFVEGDLEFLSQNGIQIVNSIKESDIIVSQNFKKLKKHFWRTLNGKDFLIWTNEPRFNTNMTSPVNVLFGLVKYHVMNIYTGDVFVSNTTFHASLFKKSLNYLPSDFKLKNRKIIALMSHYDGVKTTPIIYNNSNIDLIGLRTRICLDGHTKGVLDIFGKGWPSGISKEDSREGNWVERKKKLLNPYSFNLCFENTAVFNYMTEKIWDSIENYCLPIYYGKHTNVYSLFPENSFLDYSEFSSPGELFNKIAEMSDQEYINRMNSCLKVYNELSTKSNDFVKGERQKMLAKIIDKVKIIKSIN